MNTIPSSKVLEKISELAVKAKEAQSEEKRLGYVVAIKTLCELLEQEAADVNEQYTPESSVAFVSSTGSALQQKVPIDDANGTSLLDF